MFNFYKNLRFSFRKSLPDQSTFLVIFFVFVKGNFFLSYSLIMIKADLKKKITKKGILCVLKKISKAFDLILVLIGYEFVKMIYLIIDVFEVMLNPLFYNMNICIISKRDLLMILILKIFLNMIGKIKIDLIDLISKNSAILLIWLISFCTDKMQILILKMYSLIDLRKNKMELIVAQFESTIYSKLKDIYLIVKCKIFDDFQDSILHFLNFGFYLLDKNKHIINNSPILII
ncbi:hypothetical protein BpHYR1_026935 [Brachionus plicatilis]|uniref:Transmembrane protein n=1 Tax=Brachionus plicatilis TaxID=10195 RepID=A0A3M7QBU0_BRAPC|nr:hypothetical protein BpHYR1_026935 [Brachionus plicatilis]